MKLHIKNFAKIDEADIEINGITVIAGENNTGKSTVGKVLYSLFTAFNDLEEKIVFERKKAICNKIAEYVNFRPENLEEIYDYVNHLIEIKDENEVNKVIDECPFDIDSGVKQDIKKYINFETNEIISLIVEKIFNLEFNNQFLPIINESGEESIVLLNIKDKKISIRFNDFYTLVFDKMKLNNKGIYIDNPFIIDRISEEESDYIRIRKSFFSIFFDYNLPRHEDVLKELLSKSIKDGGSLLEEALLKKRLKKFIAMIMETIGGKIVEKEDKFVFSFSSNNKELELANLSTGIKAFAVILKLLENKDIQDKSIIVLDEPEVHLHPKWQLIYAELLVLLQKEFDLNIVLTTHSPYFINAIEVYSEKHNLADKCKYYLADIIKGGKTSFEDVTVDIDKIYKKLADPLQQLADEEGEIDD